MFRKVLAALVAAFFLGAFVPAPAESQVANRSQVRHDCGHLYSQPYYRAIAKRAIKPGRAIARRSLYRLASMRYCARSDVAQGQMLRWTKRRLQWRRDVAEYWALTPYVCANGTRWAIPCYIVQRESGYRWWAHNPRSAARGPYQLLGHGEPWPVRTWADKMAHHRIAAHLWNGGVEANGLGPHHWRATV